MGSSALSRIGALALALAPGLAGCAGGGMALAECEGLDWRALGLADGRDGQSGKDSEKRLESCAKAGAPVSIADYRAGREEGLRAYCSADGGFAAGAKGADYEGVCPAAREPDFLKVYVIGETLFKHAQASEDAKDAYAKAERDLDQHRFLLRAAEKRAQKSTISNEDREIARQEASYRTLEINRLERLLPRLVDEIEEAGAALDAYKARLIDEGRSF